MMLSLMGGRGEEGGEAQLTNHATQKWRAHFSKESVANGLESRWVPGPDRSPPPPPPTPEGTTVLHSRNIHMLPSKPHGVVFAFACGPDVTPVGAHRLPEGKGPQGPPKRGPAQVLGRRAVLTRIGHSLVHQIHAGATQSQGIDRVVGPGVHIRHHDLRGHWGPGEWACKRGSGWGSDSPWLPCGDRKTWVQILPHSLLRYVTLGLYASVSPPIKLTCC